MVEFVIYGKNSQNERRSVSGVFSTMLHELSHAAHCLHVGFVNFCKTEDHISDGYAVAAQWLLTKNEYKLVENSKTLTSLLDFSASQSWPNNGRDNKYSPLFVDMIDTLNQGLRGGMLYDDINGYYDLASISWSLSSIVTIDDFEKYLKSKTFSKSMKRKITNYFTLYRKYYED